MKKIKFLLTTVLLGGILFCVGFTNVYAEETSEVNGEEEAISPSNIPVTIILSPQNVTKRGVTSYTVQPRLDWYDGVSNSFNVGYTNANGVRQIGGTYYSYYVNVQSTTYRITSGLTQFSGRHSATVSSLAGTDSMSGMITLYRR